MEHMGGPGSLHLATGDEDGDLSFKRKSVNQNLRDRERAYSSPPTTKYLTTALSMRISTQS